MRSMRPGFSNISVYFPQPGAAIDQKLLRVAQNEIDESSNEWRHRGYRHQVALALADAASCSGREFDYVWNSPADSGKSAAPRDAFLHAALLGNRWRLNCSRNRAKVLACVTQMD